MSNKRELAKIAKEIKEIKAQLNKSAGPDIAEMILQMVAGDQGGEFWDARQLSAFMKKSKGPISKLKSLKFPFNDDEAVMGLIASPMMDNNGRIEAEDMGLEYAIPNEETMQALMKLADAVAELF